MNCYYDQNMYLFDATSFCCLMALMENYSLTTCRSRLAKRPKHNQVSNEKRNFSYEYSHTTDRLWRKNKSKSGNTLLRMFNREERCLGTDLNRNFGFHWNDPRITHFSAGSQRRCLPTFQGRAAWTEPETRAVRNFVMANRHLIVVSKSGWWLSIGICS